MIAVPALPNDESQTIVRIDKATRDTLRVVPNGIVKVIGNSGVVSCKVHKIVSDWIGKNVVMVPTKIMKKIGAKYSQTITLKK